MLGGIEFQIVTAMNLKLFWDFDLLYHGLLEVRDCVEGLTSDH